MNIKVKLTQAVNLTHYGVPAGTAVEIDLEREYLPCCVSSEVYENNTRTPMDAKKAQAVAARTYIYAHALAGTIIDDTAGYQAFKWKDLSSIPNSVKACQETSGQVLLCNGAMITAWYSSSNGGRTKRSDEVWSSYKKWTIAQDDPWDVAGRAFWGECKASHGVGMSQIGAAYAAATGEGYKTILSFYYPNTELVGGYGKGNTIFYNEGGSAPDEGGLRGQGIENSDPETRRCQRQCAGASNEKVKTNIGLVEHAQGWVGKPYWYGCCCYKCTTSLLSSKTAQYPSHYTAARMARYKQDIADGKSCADCIGLIKGYYWEKDGKAVYDASSDVNTTGMYNKATVKGLIGTMPEVPGLIVYKTGHVGVYEGNGYVIEAKGFASGCIRSKLSDTDWTHWLACPYITYQDYEKLLLTNSDSYPYIAKVTTQTTPLNIWSDTNKAKSLAQVKKGDTLTVTGYGGKVGWLKVEKDGVTGYADGQYLTFVEGLAQDSGEAQAASETSLSAEQSEGLGAKPDGEQSEADGANAEAVASFDVVIRSVDASTATYLLEAYPSAYIMAE